MKSEEADAIVVGGGPAGSTAATLLKLANPTSRIMLIERSAFPRHHIGESTLPAMNSILKELGVLDAIASAGFLRKGGITYEWRRDRAIFTDRFPGTGDKVFGQHPHHDQLPSHSWQVERSRYDQILLENARSRGVEVHQETEATRLLQKRERVAGLRLSGRDLGEREVWCRHVIDCSGQARFLPRQLGLKRDVHNLGDLAIYGYYAGFEWREDLLGPKELSNIYFCASPSGWIWFIPLSEKVVSVGVVTRRDVLRGSRPEALFEKEVREAGKLWSMIEKADLTADPSGKGDPRIYTIRDWSYSHHQVAGPGWYLAGDSGVFVDPILSTGVLLAHTAGMSAAHAVHTEWHHNEVSPEELRTAYDRFYRDAAGGFLVMANWWYHQRNVGIEDWWRRAKELSGKAPSATGLDDVRSFMFVVAGYLTDFRFHNIGVSFGDTGLSAVLDAFVDSGGATASLRRSITDRNARLIGSFESVQPASYLSTFVTTPRWWRLPAGRFVKNGTGTLYRPPILYLEPTERFAHLSERVLESVVRNCTGGATIDEVILLARKNVGSADRPHVEPLASLMMSDLMKLGLLIPAP